jgi:hypothetical protein
MGNFPGGNFVIVSNGTTNGVAITSNGALSATGGFIGDGHLLTGVGGGTNTYHGDGSTITAVTNGNAVTFSGSGGGITASAATNIANSAAASATVGMVTNGQGGVTVGLSITSSVPASTIQNAPWANASGSLFIGTFTKVDNEGLVPAISGDGVNWNVSYNQRVLGTNPAYFIANDSYWRLGPRNYLMVSFYGTNVLNTTTSEETGFAVFTSTNFILWNFVTNYPVAIPGLQQVWAPELFVESNNVNVFFAAQSTNYGSFFQIYSVTATNSAFTGWTAPNLITNLIMTSSHHAIDPFVFKDGTNYDLFFKDDNTKYICLAQSASLTSGYTVIRSNDWAGWGANLEAPCVEVRPDGQYILIADNNQYFYSLSTNLLGPWTAMQAVNSPGLVLRHGTFHQAPMTECSELFADAQNQNGKIVGFSALAVGNLQTPISPVDESVTYALNVRNPYNHQAVIDNDGSQNLYSGLNFASRGVDNFVLADMAPSGMFGLYNFNVTNFEWTSSNGVFNVTGAITINGIPVLTNAVGGSTNSYTDALAVAALGAVGITNAGANAVLTNGSTGNTLNNLMVSGGGFASPALTIINGILALGSNSLTAISASGPSLNIGNGGISGSGNWIAGVPWSALPATPLTNITYGNLPAGTVTNLASVPSGVGLTASPNLWTASNNFSAPVNCSAGFTNSGATKLGGVTISSVGVAAGFNNVDSAGSSLDHNVGGQIVAKNSGQIGFSATSSGTASPDTYLTRVAANQLAVNGSFAMTNAVFYPWNSTTGPTWITNGASGIWNSNGVITLLRTSLAGQTTYTDHLLFAH